MYIKQISVFLENTKGSLSRLTRLLSKGGVDLVALTIADTEQYGIMRCIVSDTELGVKIMKDEQATQTMAEKLIAMMPMAAMVVGAMLSVWLILEEMSVAAVLAAMLTAIAWLETQVIYRRRLAVAAFSKVDKHELLRLVDRLMESMDDALEMSAQQAASERKLESGERPMLTGDVLGSVQMLMEAVQTGDGEYALKAVPALTAALMEQGIEAVNYSQENEEYFDLYPGTEKGITIRPALLKDGKVIARGQATEAME